MDTRKRMLFVINPVSGKKNSKNQILDVLNEFSKHGYFVETYITQAANDAYEYLLRYAKNYDVVAISGGDGTLNEATNALIQLDKKPLIGYLPSGTMNDFGYNFGLSTDLEAAAKTICEGRIDAFDLGKIDDQYFNYVAGFGMICEVSFETDQELKHVLGNLAYIIKAVSMLPNLRPYHVKLNIDGKIIEKDLMFGLVVNGIRVSGFDLIEKSEDAMKDGMLNVILVEHTPKLLELYNYPIGLLNPSVNGKYVTRYQAKHIEILADEPMKWTLDGEKGKERDKAEITVIPKALKIIR